MTKLRTLVAGVFLAFAIVPVTAPPAHACWSVQCVVNCVHDLASGEFACRL
ncbi:MAG: hypothetical protein M3279_00705 [Actinomycetota bacterium]|nr:hypothetical protein [Actinomycetota bacterium]